jgi:hypothetical protein
LAAVTSLVFVLSRFLPSGRQGAYGIIEDFWIQMLHTAFAKRLQFGRDIVFTFGPWGFLYGGYHPATSERTGIENKWFALTGRVVAVKVEADGDLHIALADATGDKPGFADATDEASRRQPRGR